MHCRPRKKTSSPVVVSKPSADPLGNNKQVKQQVSSRKEEVTSSSPRTSSPVSRVSSPKTDNVKMEKGPVHQFNQSKNLGQALSDRSKKFNNVPKPFGKSDVTSR